MFAPGGATGGRGTSINSDNVSMSPTFSDSVFSDIDVDNGRVGRDPRSNRPGLPQGSHSLQFSAIDSNKLFVPIKKKRGQSPSGSSPDRNSETGSTRNRLVDFDLEPRYESFPNRPSSDTGVVNGARPKQINSDRTKKYRNKTHFKVKENSNFSGINSASLTDDIRPVSKDSGVGSTNFLDATSDSVRISEQQNTNVNEERFSAALSLFDPLTEGDSLASGDLLEGAGSPPPSSPPFQSFRNPNYEDMSSSIPMEPAKDQTTASKCQFEFPSATGSSVATGNLIDVAEEFMQTENQSKPRRGSTDSNRSSGSSLSKDGDRQAPAHDKVWTVILFFKLYIFDTLHPHLFIQFDAFIQGQTIMSRGVIRSTSARLP